MRNIITIALLTGMGIGFLIGVVFTGSIAGSDWQHKVDAKEFSWKNVDYIIVEQKK